MARRSSPRRNNSRNTPAPARPPEVRQSALFTYRDAQLRRTVQALLPGKTPVQVRRPSAPPPPALRNAPTRPTAVRGLVASGPIRFGQSVQGDSPRRVTPRDAAVTQSVQGDSPRRVTLRDAAVTQSVQGDSPRRVKEDNTPDKTPDRTRDRCKPRPEPRRGGGGGRKRFSPWCK